MGTPHKTYMRNTSIPVTNWHVAIDGLPGKIGVTDMDGVIERNGHFLWMESKNPNENMTTGQRILLEALTKTPKHTAIVVYMDTTTGDVYSFSQFKDGAWVEQPLTNRQFQAMLAKWFAKASKDRRPK